MTYVRSLFDYSQTIFNPRNIESPLNVSVINHHTSDKEYKMSIQEGKESGRFTFILRASTLNVICAEKLQNN